MTQSNEELGMSDSELGKRFREIVIASETRTDFNSSMLTSLKVRWRAMYDLIKEVK